MITFPTTPEAFVAYQEKGINRKLDDFELKLADAVVDLTNISYQELICKGLFLPPNTYDCGSFVVN